MKFFALRKKRHFNLESYNLCEFVNFFVNFDYYIYYILYNLILIVIYVYYILYNLILFIIGIVHCIEYPFRKIIF